MNIYQEITTWFGKPVNIPHRAVFTKQFSSRFRGLLNGINLNDRGDHRTPPIPRLKQYEARSFVGLSRTNTGTAAELSDVTDIPRTRIYDAIKALENEGLVETQHSNPKRFRAIPFSEAIETLRDHYEDHLEELQDAMKQLDTVDVATDEPAQQVWTMAGHAGIERRTTQLLEAAIDEIVLVIGDESVLTTTLISTLNEVTTDTDVRAGALTKSLEAELQDVIPEATTFTSGLEWLHAENTTKDEPAIGRLLLVDRSNILVSSIESETKAEQAVFGEGFDNGLIMIARRLMSQGLLSDRDPGA